MQSDRSDVEVVRRETAFQGYFRVDRYLLRHLRFDGAWSGVMQREIFERGHAAAVLPYDPVRDRVVLIEQFRLGAYAAGRNPWMYEIVAGIIDAGETAEEVAEREAVEEANCRLLRLERLFDFQTTPGACTETLTLFVGEVDSDPLGGVYGLAEEHEDIKVHVLPADDALALLRENRVTNATALIALQWFALNRVELRRRWLAESGATAAAQD